MSEDKLREQFEAWWFSGEIKSPILISEHSMFFADQAWQACANIKDAEIEQLNAELERERMRLSACGVVALANTEESATKARLMHDDYRSASCGDVARMVDVQMKLRTQVEQLNAKVAMLKNMVESIWVVIPKETFFSKATIESANAKLSATEADVTKFLNGVRTDAVAEYLKQAQATMSAKLVR
jgi:hypothetical protein